MSVEVTPPITVTAPSANLYWNAYKAFFKQHACKLMRTAERAGLSRCLLCQIPFPLGTQKQAMAGDLFACYKLILPDGTEGEERQAGGSDYSFLYANVRT